MTQKHKKRMAHKELKQAAVVLILSSLAVFLFLRSELFHAYLEKTFAKQQSRPPQTGYKDKDRQELERLIHEGAKHD